MEVKQEYDKNKTTKMSKLMEQLKNGFPKAKHK